MAVQDVVELHDVDADGVSSHLKWGDVSRDRLALFMKLGLMGLLMLGTVGVAEMRGLRRERRAREKMRDMIGFGFDKSVRFQFGVFYL